MSEKKWTSGPWVVEECGGAEHDKSRFENGAYQVFSNDCNYHAVADCSCNHTCRDEGECMANANLIAAAPELYEALEDLFKEITADEYKSSLRPELAQAARALSKARGEA